jgi:hypothetical protein
MRRSEVPPLSYPMGFEKEVRREDVKNEGNGIKIITFLSKCIGGVERRFLSSGSNALSRRNKG